MLCGNYESDSTPLRCAEANSKPPQQNEYAGKRLLWVGIGTVFAAVALFLLPIPNVGVYATAVGGIVMVGLVVTLAQ